MFADPTTVTIGANARNLVRINQDKYSSEYCLVLPDREIRLFIRNTSYLDKKRSSVKMNRHNAELIETVFPVAPAVTSIVRKAYAVFENQQGDTLTDPVNVTVALFNMLTASSAANLNKMVNNES